MNMKKQILLKSKISRIPLGFSNFPLGKKIILIMLLILPIVFALESSKVYIIDLSYKDGELIINDKIVKYGYAPDRKLQPLEGYRAEIASLAGDILYTFKFKIPLDEYVDISDNITQEISGGLIKLSENDFALVLPYYDTAKEVVFYDEENNEVVSVDIEEEKEELEKEKEEYNYWIWILEFLILLVLVVLFIRHKIKEKKEEE